MFGWFSRIFGGAGLDNPDQGPQSSGSASHQTESGLVLTDERALSITAVWSCVRLISETVASLPLAVYERTPDGRAPVTDHYLWGLLRESPNDMMDPLAFREAMTMQLALYGNGYAKIERNNAGKPYALTPLKADQMTPVKEAGTVTYHYQTDKGEHIFAKDSIFHLKGFGPDGIVGLSPLAYARHTLGISASADKYAGHSFAKGGRPRGVMTTDRILTPDQRATLKRIYEGIGDQTSDGTWVLEAGVDYKGIDIPPDDMQMLQSRAFQLSEVARTFRVPSFLINDTEKSTSWGTGLEQTNLAFLTYTLRPYLTRWESTISHALLDRTQRRKYFVEHNVEGLLRADSAARASFYSQMVQNGLYSRNEVRKKENMPPVPGGDDLTIQVNLTPVDQLPTVQPQPLPEMSKSDVYITFPQQQFELKPTIDVQPAAVNVKTEPPQVSVKVDKRGNVERVITEYDERGFPKKMIEKEID